MSTNATDAAPLSSSDQDLLGQFARFAERQAVNGVYINTMCSLSLGTKVMVIVAMGEQADALNAIVMQHAVAPDQEALVERTKDKF